MGIRGLTSYITQNSGKFYEPFQLCDCTLVIDGCSLACYLHLEASDLKPVFGGDYDNYAQNIEHFFFILEQCNVVPVVVIDGGYEGRKLKTVLRRLKEKMNAASLSNATESKRSVFPLLLMEAFKQTLLKINVKFVQTDFEADQEIAAIAKELKCPVLSNDSDFYVNNVMYVPISTLHCRPSQRKQNNSVKYFLNCELFKMERLSSRLGGIDCRLLPLVSFLLGNDYVDPSVFNKFVEQIMLSKFKKIVSQPAKLGSIFEWLKNETLESAITKMLKQLKKKEQPFVKKQMELAIHANRRVSSKFTPYLGVETVKVVPQSGNSSLDLMSETLVKDETETTESGDENSDCDPMDELHEANLPSSFFPSWLKEKFRKGELSTCLSDIFHLHIYLCHPQVENFSHHDSHSISFPILKIIFGILKHGAHVESLKRKDGMLSCYTRKGSDSLQIIDLEPTMDVPGFSTLPTTSSIPNLPLSVRRTFFFSSLGIYDINDVHLLESFSEDWKLFASVIVFWSRTVEFPKITFHHLHSLIVCMVALGVVDKKVGRIRNQKDLQSRKAHFSKTVNQKGLESSDLKDQENATLANVSESDCLSLAESLLQLHQFRCKQISKDIVHTFAQFQACLGMIMALNSLLEFPVNQCQLSYTFSGSLAYATCLSLRMTNVEVFIRTLMGKTPSLYQMYKDILDKFTSLLPDKLAVRKNGKLKTKTNRRTLGGNLQQQRNKESKKFVPGHTSNKFSLLSNVAVANE